MKSYNGCWTCRLRRKKCDEQQPACNACSSLLITCHYSKDKPEWLDGGARQSAMAETLKEEVKAKAPFRFREPAAPFHQDAEGPTRATTAYVTNNVQPLDIINGSESNSYQNSQSTPPSLDRSPRIDSSCSQARNLFGEAPPLAPSDLVLISHFLEHVFPYLFPFYRPPAMQGGSSWLLQMTLSSVVLRQSATCQSSFFLSLAQEAGDQAVRWEAMLSRTNEVFGTVRQALQILEKSNFSEHVHGTVGLIATLIHWQHFEIAVVGFDNWRMHFNAAMSFFEGLMHSTGSGEHESSSSTFASVLERLGPSTTLNLVSELKVPSAEQAAFRFSTTLLIFQDIIASTVLQARPRLCNRYGSLFESGEGSVPPLDLEDVVGCHTLVLICISETAVLDAWKKDCQDAGNLDVMELVRRATAIKSQLELFTLRDEQSSMPDSGLPRPHSELLTPETARDVWSLSKQHSPATRVWAHAAQIYLTMVVSGWQFENVQTRHHVGQILELLSTQLSQPEKVRTMIWPFCVAGCLANPPMHCGFRNLARLLRPKYLYKTASKALEIMEDVWTRREQGRCMPPDLSACFQDQDTAFLLI